MAVTADRVRFSEESLAEVQVLLRELDLGGWLLYDFRGNNPVSAGVLGLPPLTRRVFVLIPRTGRPIALTHRIEQQVWVDWIGENRPYLSWQSLEAELGRALAGRGRVALEVSQGDAIPYIDRVPAGVVDLIRQSGVELVSSGDLVSAMYSRWSEEGEASHRRAAGIVREVAFDAFRRIGEAIASGEIPTEWAIREWIVEQLVHRGLPIGADAIVAIDVNAANPHYAPAADAHSGIARGNTVLIDLWGKATAEAIYADQTWMAFVGDDPPARVRRVFEAVRDARVAAVDFIRSRHEAGEPVHGFEVDDVARTLIDRAGFGENFIHRTGHSIDRELHGSGPNIDNLETRDGRRLIRGIGFSIEPGIYLEGELGVRSEINVFMGASGPVVTTPEPQMALHRISIG